MNPQSNHEVMRGGHYSAKQNLENKKPAVFMRRLGGDEKSKCPGESSIKSWG
jgi:hypothetical protein